MNMGNKLKIIKQYFKTVEYWFDYYFVYFLYNGNKIDKYYEYMEKKWGGKK
jgi:hypothetical protein